MDSLTQIALGAAVGEAVLGRKVGNKAMLYGAIAGTIPDLDTFVGAFTDVITAVEIHRGFSHSVVFSVLVGPFLGWLISRWDKTATWMEWSWLMFWGLITHPILDSFTTWGTQLFWPLDIELAFKNIFVIDPLYTLPLVVCLILAIRQRKDSSKRRVLNNSGLLLSSSYLLITLVLKGVTYNIFEESLEKQGIFYEQIQTKPAPFSSVLWTANVEVEDAFLIGDYSFFDEEELVRFRTFPKNHHYLGSWSEDPNVKRLIDIANGWYIITEKDGELYFNDLRFGQINPYEANSPFTFSYKLAEVEGKVTAEEVEKRPENAGKILSDLWQRMLGNNSYSVAHLFR